MSLEIAKKWNEAYRNGEELVNDKEYDALYEQLSDEDKEKVAIGGNVPESKRKTKLPIPMYSMDKIKTIDELRKWQTSKDIKESDKLIITPKFDGLSFVNEYGTDNCWTRGDGKVGQKSNEHFNMLSQTKEFGNSVKLDGNHIFGEVIMKRSVFSNNYKGKPVMRDGKSPKNPRNFVAGLFNADKPSEILKDVEFVCYGLGNDLGTKVDMLNILNIFNTVSVPFEIMELKDVTHEILEELYHAWGYEFEIDGVVIELNDISIRSSLGRERNNNPAYARAYKFESEIKETKIKNIEWSVSKEGKMCPVANLEPIELGGVTISRVTCNNAKFVENNNLKSGITVGICRSGDVIPRIVSLNGDLLTT